MSEWAQFTEAAYGNLVQKAATCYRFASFRNWDEGPVVLWRHDVDGSVHRARRLAEIERSLGVRSTYFFLLHSEFYSLFERSVRDLAREIIGLGHWAGLHFDASFHEITGEESLRREAAKEQALLQDLLDAPVGALSFHNPTVEGGLPARDAEIAGMANAYSDAITSEFAYVSDSNGLWRGQPAMQLLHPQRHPRVHVLTHPMWWTPEPRSPRHRIERCLRGRAEAAGASYDALLAAHGRPNIW